MLQENLERSKSSQSQEILASTERASYQFAEGMCLGRTPDHMPGWRARHLKVLLILKSDYRIINLQIKSVLKEFSPRTRILVSLK